MHPAAVQEHRRERSRPERRGDERRELASSGVFARHDTPRLDKRLQRRLRPVDLKEECEHVQSDQGPRHNRFVARPLRRHRHRKHPRLLWLRDRCKCSRNRRLLLLEAARAHPAATEGRLTGALNLPATSRLCANTRTISAHIPMPLMAPRTADPRDSRP